MKYIVIIRCDNDEINEFDVAVNERDDLNRKTFQMIKLKSKIKRKY